MQSTVDTLQKVIDQRHSRYVPLVGKFHAHLTIELTEGQRDACQEFCVGQKVKLTTVDLANNHGRQQTDVMLTSHYLDREPNAVFRITNHLATLASQANVSGFPVVRAKLEHESLPSFSSFDDCRYHEVHIKLRLPHDSYEADYQRLITLGEEHGFVPSRNPYSRKTEYVSQFVNLRIYEGTHTQASDRVEELQTLLTQEGFGIEETKRETVVFDTAQELDRWWA